MSVGPPAKLKVGLVQINNSFSGQNYLPYSVGILQAYAQKNLADPERFEFLLPLYKRTPVDDAVSRLLGADIVFFSTYVWNIRLSLEVARRLKLARPSTITVMGGPQVPNRADEFLAKNPFVDIAAHGEGEMIFASILENAPARTFGLVPSITYRKEGELQATARLDRIKQLASVPSPYLDGVFEPLMRANPDEKWIVLWETNRGCPFSCTFRDWGSAIASKVFPFDMERLAREVEWFAERRIEFVFCADANFGILPRDPDIVKPVA
ncbi:cobalamin B12-binding domain-containing protein, partial [bacterium]|nr:cobalamin B12-binding domain-containing protein [bacterium]